MKKLLLLVLVAILAIGTSFAQKGESRAAKLQKEIDGLTTELGLSKDQVTKVTPIIEESQKKQSAANKKLREGGAQVDRAKMKEEKAKLTAETDKLLKTVLSVEQAVKLEAYRNKPAKKEGKGKKSK